MMKPNSLRTHIRTLTQYGCLTLVISGCSYNPFDGFNAKPTYSPDNPDNEVAEVQQDGPPRQYKDVARISNAVPKLEPRSRYGNHSPYEVRGKTYEVLSSGLGYEEEGLASWYGEKFSGKYTSTMETYDPYEMTAAHKSLPLPTYARVTNLDNNRSVIVKINDRGPFHDDRLIDLSYAAAVKLGYHDKGTARVKIEAINPVDYVRTQEDAVVEEIPKLGSAAASSVADSAVDTTASTDTATAMNADASSKEPGEPAIKINGKNLPAPKDIPVKTLVNNRPAIAGTQQAGKAAAGALGATVGLGAAAAKQDATLDAARASAYQGASGEQGANGEQSYNRTIAGGEPEPMQTWSSTPTKNTASEPLSRPAGAATDPDPSSSDTIASQPAEPMTEGDATVNTTEDNVTGNALASDTSATEDTVATAAAAPTTTQTTSSFNESSGDLYLQAGAFKELQSASRMKKQLSNVTQESVEIRSHIINDEKFFRVLVGPFPDHEQAITAKEEIRDSKVAKPMVVRR